MNWLLLRGLTRNQRHWGDFPDRFAAALGDEVLCLDAPGFGTEADRPSPKAMSDITDDIRDRFLRVRSNGDWSILGISLGGMVTLDWCARYPDDFGRAVVINTSAADSGRVRDRFRPSTIRLMATGLARPGGSIERRILETSLNRKEHDLDALAEQWTQWAREVPVTRANVLGQIRAASGFTLPEQMSVPLLVLSSRGDRMVSSQNSEVIAHRLGAALEVHDETAGHDLPADDPAWVCDRIRNWQV